MDKLVVIITTHTLEQIQFRINEALDIVQSETAQTFTGDRRCTFANDPSATFARVKRAESAMIPGLWGQAKNQFPCSVAWDLEPPGDRWERSEEDKM